jgi:3-hydroxyisobutyrate dehydrogenase-like beta-hydroxyacid dehydrogenase
VSEPATVAVLGLGEAGSRFAADLVKAGSRVKGFDPADVPTPDGVERHHDPQAAVTDASVVLALTAAADARTALTQALDGYADGALYADLATSAAGQKRDLAAIAGSRGLDFTDVALMSTVPGNGLGTPSLASGPGSRRYVATMTPLGARCEVVSDSPGDAATRKLLRSVVMKGLTATLIEAMRAAEAAGQAEWLWPHLVEEITAADEALLSRLVAGTGPHARRRRHEMESTVALLEELGIDPVMTRATVENLRRIPDEGVPRLPSLSDD